MDSDQSTPTDDSSSPSQDDSAANQEPLATIDLPADLPDLQSMPDSGTITFQYSKVPADDGSGATSLDLTSIVSVGAPDSDDSAPQSKSQAFDQTAASVMSKKGKSVQPGSSSEY